MPRLSISGNLPKLLSSAEGIRHLSVISYPLSLSGRGRLKAEVYASTCCKCINGVFFAHSDDYYDHFAVDFA